MRAYIKLIVIFNVLALLFLSGCGGIKMLSGGARSDLYRPAFTQKLNIAKTYYGRGEVQKALNELNTFDENTLNGPEKALRRNLIGVIYFGKGSFEQAIFNFKWYLKTERCNHKV